MLEVRVFGGVVRVLAAKTLNPLSYYFLNDSDFHSEVNLTKSFDDTQRCAGKTFFIEKTQLPWVLGNTSFYIKVKDQDKIRRISI